MVILGLGSNIGDRTANLAAAMRALAPMMQNMRLSRILESEALLPANATPDMNLPFLNMAIGGDCALAPQSLLQQVKSLEVSLGRVKRSHWGPREIDIDILAWDDVVLESPELAIPHKELLNRDFALVPLGDIAPGWKYPLNGPYFQDTAVEIIRKNGYGLNDTLRDTGLTLDV